jgi:hypothetical protein
VQERGDLQGIGQRRSNHKLQGGSGSLYKIRLGAGFEGGSWGST